MILSMALMVLGVVIHSKWVLMAGVIIAIPIIIKNTKGEREDV